MPQIWVTDLRKRKLRQLKEDFKYNSYDEVLKDALDLLEFVLRIDESTFPQFQKFLDDLLSKHDKKVTWRLFI